MLSFSGFCEDKFTIAVIPDSQQEILNDKDTRLKNRMQWLADNKKDLNLKMVLHVGDMMNWDTPDHAQYERNSKGFEILDKAGIPYALALGNHDTAATKEGGSAAPGNVNTNLRNTSTFDTYFPTTRFKALEGVFEKGKVGNSCHTFKAGGLDWLVISLELWARTEEVEWAKKVVEDHPRHNIIIVTHSFLNGGSAIEKSNGGYGNNSPQFIFDNLVKKYGNIRLVFCGHVGGHGYRTDKGGNGNTIYEFVQCYHDNATNPVRLFEIDTKNGSINTWVYCPSISKEKDDKSSFTVKDVSWVTSGSGKTAK
ncbi:MAG: hypothetical protein A2X48_13240 [Lentisphaerae bacterium GWF2_49_21]|nr:MAG: hypothetical protein A2X48_13240 [Lentisphaerae bacterium GWF2_49_21]